MWVNALLPKEVLRLTCLANVLENMWWMPLKIPAWQSLSAMVSLHLGTSHKMLLNWGKAAGTLAVCLLVGFHLSPVMETPGLTLHSHIACCRQYSPPFTPILVFCLCFFSFRLRRSWGRDVCSGKRRKKTTLELLKKMQCRFQQRATLKKAKELYTGHFLVCFSENKVDGNSWRL